MSKQNQENIRLATVVVLMLGTVSSLSFLYFHQYDLKWAVHLVHTLLITLLAAGTLGLCTSAPAWPKRKHPRKSLQQRESASSCSSPTYSPWSVV